MSEILIKVLEVIATILGVAGIGGILGLLLKKFITKERVLKLKSNVEAFGQGIGQTITISLAKWKYTKGIWNKVIEPYVIVFLKVFIKGFLDGIIKGLLSDKPSYKE